MGAEEIEHCLRWTGDNSSKVVMKPGTTSGSRSPRRLHQETAFALCPLWLQQVEVGEGHPSEGSAFSEGSTEVGRCRES